jgi:hypothetical protein
MQELKEGGRVEVNIKPVYIFLFKNGGLFPPTPLYLLPD